MFLARKIIKSAEKHLIQARIKSINSILDNNTKQTELCRSKLASILSTPMFRKCQGILEKVGEIRFNKVKSRQVNKLNNVLKKEGNITAGSSQITTFSSSQAGRQAGKASQEVSAVPPIALLPGKVSPRKEAIPRLPTMVHPGQEQQLSTT